MQKTKIKTLKKLTVGLLAVVFGFTSLPASVALADGMIVPPPGRMIYETDQKAVIFYEDGLERLIVSISFHGDAKDFAWVVPTPTKPEVNKSVDSLFERLDELTRPEIPMPSYDRGFGAAKNMQMDAEEAVTVVETKKIEYYDIAVLEVKKDGEDALYNWLNDNGYSFPQAGKDIVDEYIEKGWYFTAVKIDDKKASNLTQRQLSSGHAVPLELAFETDEVVYPLKISSINGLEDNAPEGEVTYIEGKNGRAVQIDKGKSIATDKVVTGFNGNSGAISFYLKKRKDDAVGDILQIKKEDKGKYYQANVSNPFDDMIVLEVGSDKNQKSFELELGSDFVENQWQKYEFSWRVTGSDASAEFAIDEVNRSWARVDGNPYGSSLLDNIYSQEAEVIIGGNKMNHILPDYDDVFIREEPLIESDMEIMPMPEPMPVAPRRMPIIRQSDILIDELKISSSGGDIFKASFEGDLECRLEDDRKNKLRIFDREFYPDMMMGPNSMGVLLYVFSDKKYEVPGFDLQFAGKLSKKEVQDLAKIDGKKPWIEPKGDEYFLTRSYRFMQTVQMTEDLYPVASDDDSAFNYPGNESSKLGWVIVLLVISIGSVVSMTYVLIKKK